MQAACRVEDHHVAQQTLRLGDGRRRDRVDLPAPRVKWHVFALRQNAQLLHRSGAPQVERREQRLVAFSPREQRELDGGRRLARTLQADEHDHGRRRGGVADSFGVATKQLHQLRVDSLNNVLRGGQARRDLDALESRAHPLDELLDDPEVDVRFEQRQANFAQAGVDVFRSKHTPAGDLLERRRQPVSQCLKHRCQISSCAMRRFRPASSCSSEATLRRLRPASPRRPSRRS